MLHSYVFPGGTVGIAHGWLAAASPRTRRFSGFACHFYLEKHGLTHEACSLWRCLIMHVSIRHYGDIFEHLGLAQSLLSAGIAWVSLWGCHAWLVLLPRTWSIRSHLGRSWRCSGSWWDSFTLQFPTVEVVSIHWLLSKALSWGQVNVLGWPVGRVSPYFILCSFR